MGSGRPRTATVLKILEGTARPERRRDESAVVPSGKPELPRFITLDADEREVYEWMVASFANVLIHGRPDGAMIAACAKKFVFVQRIEKKVTEFGAVVKDPKTGRPMRSPFEKVHAESSYELRRMMAELGFTPVSRLRFAPQVKGKGPEMQTWDKFD